MPKGSNCEKYAIQEKPAFDPASVLKEVRIILCTATASLEHSDDIYIIGCGKYEGYY